ncbi:MAG: hypothetical protein WC979_01955 [Candidatus Pacearchaeota archaeon]|jgi:hypothetical protein|nr:hypothetical protein [Clostridia bacterium]
MEKRIPTLDVFINENINEAKAKQKFVVLRRDNPQLKNPYYMVRGQMSAKDIKTAENPSYGYITAELFDTEEEMNAFIEQKKAEGLRVS